MINVPVPPSALVTRQITCICCHEQFVISVDEPDRRRPGAAESWYVPADQPESSQLRYEADRSRRQASPIARAVPEPNPVNSPHHDPYYFYSITCPRCGADNRNWLNFQQRPFPQQHTLLIGYTLTGLAGLGVLLLLVNPTVMPRLEMGKWTHWLPLTIALILAGLLPLLLIPGLWYETRLRNYTMDVVPAMKGSLAPVARRAFLIWGILALLLPLIFYAMLPLLQEVQEAIFAQEPTLVTHIDRVSAQVDRLGDSAPVNNAFMGLTAVLNTQLRACEKTQINQMIADLQAISAANPHGNLLLVTRASEQLVVIREMASQGCRIELIQNVKSTLQPIINETNPYPLPADLNLQQCRNQWQAANEGQNAIVDPACYNFLLVTLLTDLGRIEDAHMPIRNRAGILAETRLLAAAPGLLPGVQGQIASNMATLENSLPGAVSAPLLNWRFLVFWFTAVSLTWLVCTVCANAALHQRIGWLDPHVPRPIFTSVASMTRVAVWEAKQALEMSGYEHRIQWMRAIRNEVGGVDLAGFFRDPPDLLADGTMNPLVRTQRYGLSTDIWCRIREARITDMMTPRPAGSPTFVLPELSPAEIRIGRHRL